MIPVQFKKETEETILIRWDDGREFFLPMKYLRDRCPCASCAGETVLWKEYKPPELNVIMPGKYNLKGAEVIGNYALALTWLDGHNTGIYSFEYLRELCEEYVKEKSAADRTNEN